MESFKLIIATSIIIFIGLLIKSLFFDYKCKCNKENFYLKQNYEDYAKSNLNNCSKSSNCKNCQYYNYDHNRVNMFDHTPVFRQYCGFRLVRP